MESRSSDRPVEYGDETSGNLAAVQRQESEKKSELESKLPGRKQRRQLTWCDEGTEYSRPICKHVD